jgi:hypothetical protein
MVVGLEELFKDPVPVRRRDPDAGVDHVNLDALAGMFHPHRHRPGSGEFDRIAQ